MYCSKCGKQLPNDARFCESCGAPIPQKTNTHREPLAPTKEGNSQDIGNVFKQPNIKRAFFVIVGIALVLVLLSAVYFALSSRSSQTAKPSQTEASNLTAKPSPVVALAIGDSYQGGKIAYLLVSGDPGYDANVQHGLIAATADQGIDLVWLEGNYSTTGATATAIGTGNANTNTIVTNQGAGSGAARLCADLVLGGYSDWYLPSKDELNQLCLNQTAVGGFVSADYCSSSEDGTAAAWVQTFASSGAQPNNYKHATHYVRAVRTF